MAEPRTLTLCPDDDVDNLYACYGDNPARWCFDDAQQLIRQLQPLAWPLGWHVTLGGGVLNNGYSAKDLDLYVMPRYVAGLVNDLEGVQKALAASLGVPNEYGPVSLPGHVCGASSDRAKPFVWFDVNKIDLQVATKIMESREYVAIPVNGPGDRALGVIPPQGAFVWSAHYPGRAVDVFVVRP